MSDSELTNIDIALYALYDLGGHEKKVHTEEVAYRAYELAEERFGWRLPRFREKRFPDKEPVRIALMDAAKVKNHQLVDGRSGVEAKGKDVDGWFFTPGQSTYRQRLASILEPSHVGEFVAVEPDSGRYFLGTTASAALVAAHGAMPNTLFYLTRVGRETAHTVGGHATRIP